MPKVLEAPERRQQRPVQLPGLPAARNLVSFVVSRVSHEECRYGADLVNEVSLGASATSCRA